MVYGVVHRGSPALLYNYCRTPRRAVERRRGILRRVPCNRVSLVVGSVAQELPSHPSKESQLVAMHPAVTTRACGVHQPHPQASTLLGVLAIQPGASSLFVAVSERSHKEEMQPTHVSLWLRPNPASRGGEGSGESCGWPGQGRSEQALIQVGIRQAAVIRPSGRRVHALPVSVRMIGGGRRASLR
jgi:hypothetical protein